MRKKREIIEELEKSEEETASKIIRYLGVFLITAGTICLVAFAWFLIIVGVLGLFLPIIPGLVLILIGATLLGGKKFKNYLIKLTTKIIRRIKKDK